MKQYLAIKYFTFSLAQQHLLLLFNYRSPALSLLFLFAYLHTEKKTNFILMTWWVEVRNRDMHKGTLSCIFHPFQSLQTRLAISIIKIECTCECIRRTIRKILHFRQVPLDVCDAMAHQNVNDIKMECLQRIWFFFSLSKCLLLNEDDDVEMKVYFRLLLLHKSKPSFDNLKASRVDYFCILSKISCYKK